MSALAPISDRSAARALLAAERLPTEDLDSVELFTLASGAVYGGLEVFGAVALLRSILVPPGFRGRSLGREMVSALETHARERGVRQFWLLTTGAATFFESLGYVRAERAAAPKEIRATSEFSTLCSPSATCLTKALK